jgi:hypothetical protein
VESGKNVPTTYNNKFSVKLNLRKKIKKKIFS